MSEPLMKIRPVVRGLPKEAVTESVSRLQASTQQAGTKIEQALTSAASRMKDAA